MNRYKVNGQTENKTKWKNNLGIGYTLKIGKFFWVEQWFSHCKQIFYSKMIYICFRFFTKFVQDCLLLVLIFGGWRTPVYKSNFISKYICIYLLLQLSQELQFGLIPWSMANWNRHSSTSAMLLRLLQKYFSRVILFVIFHECSTCKWQ